MHRDGLGRAGHRSPPRGRRPAYDTSHPPCAEVVGRLAGSRVGPISTPTALNLGGRPVMNEQVRRDAERARSPEKMSGSCLPPVTLLGGNACGAELAPESED